MDGRMDENAFENRLGAGLV